MSKPTPGPWKLSEATLWGVAGPLRWVEPIQDKKQASPFIEADAHLIAVSPELKMCCEASLVYLQLADHLDKEQLIEELKRVLAKAEGK